MHTFTTARSARHMTLRVSTSCATEFVDLTDHLARFVTGTRIHAGLLNVQTTHTTTAVVVNEHEPLLLDDFTAWLERAAPAAAGYAHDDMVRRPGVPPDEPVNGHAHCRALALASSACLNVTGGRLALGRHQRVFLVELDGPREREVSVLILGEALS